MNIKCEHCGAPYRGSISPYQKFVHCENCGSVIRVNLDESTTMKKRLLVRETFIEPSKAFKINEFTAFLSRRGVNSFDPVSGVLRLGSQQVCISTEGVVEGPEPLKSRVEKWIHIFMSEG